MNGRSLAVNCFTNCIFFEIKFCSPGGAVSRSYRVDTASGIRAVERKRYDTITLQVLRSD